jgi:hypothetical protein
MPLRVLVLALGISTVAAAQQPPRKQIVEDLRLDATTEDFPNIRYLEVGPRGQLAVFIFEDQNLRLYDSTGRKVGTFGRRGAGPKESRAIIQMGWKADTLWTYDNGLKRMTFMTASGEFLRHELIPANLNAGSSPDAGSDPTGMVFRFNPQGVLPDGRLLAWADVATGRDAGGHVITKSSIVVAPLDGSNRKIVGAQESAAGVSISFRDNTDSIRSGGVPFKTYPSLSYATDGTRFGSVTHTYGEKTGTYTVRVMRSTGDTMFIRTFPYTGIPIPKAVRDSALDRVGSTRYSPAARSRLRDMAQPLTPLIYSAVSSVLHGKDNITWLEMRPTPAGHEAIALDAKGTPMLSVLLPAGVRITDGSGTRLWGIHTDDDGLQHVVRYRIR